MAHRTSSGISMRNRQTSCIWLLLLGACSITTAMKDRSGAFIGYSESAYGRCSDKLPSCQGDASLNKCITDPYRMRRLCPVSCLVEPCVSRGTIMDTFVFQGHATEGGTGAYAKALATTVGANHFNRIAWGYVDASKPQSPSTFLYLSSLGTGTYLGGADDVTDEQVLTAILYAAARGWNVIDTAANFRNGRAEAAIGRALSVLLMGSKGIDFPESRVEVARDALFISSKAGYLTPGLKQQLLAARLVNASDIYGGVHCLAPACIRASLASSLKKLRLQTLDLLYLHNPAEVQLEARGKQAFFQVLRVAFKELEALRSEGKIRGYGLATWDSFRTPPHSLMHLDLEEVVKLASEVGGPQHGFMAIQAPINLVMNEAYTQKWQHVVDQTATRAAELAAKAAEEAAAKARAAAEAAAKAAAAAEGEGQQAGGSPPPPPSPSPLPAPPVLPKVIYDKVSLTDAAVKLGVQLFASAPLMESQLLQGMVGPLDNIMEYEDIRTTAAKLLQYVRSMPGVTSAIVGQKAKEHVEGNVALAAAPQLTPKLWDVVNQQLNETVVKQRPQQV